MIGSIWACRRLCRTHPCTPTPCRAPTTGVATVGDGGSVEKYVALMVTCFVWVWLYAACPFANPLVNAFVWLRIAWIPWIKAPGQHCNFDLVKRSLFGGVMLGKTVGSTQKNISGHIIYICSFFGFQSKGACKGFSTNNVVDGDL